MRMSHFVYSSSHLIETYQPRNDISENAAPIPSHASDSEYAQATGKPAIPSSACLSSSTRLVETPQKPPPSTWSNNFPMDFFSKPQVSTPCQIMISVTAWTLNASTNVGGTMFKPGPRSKDDLITISKLVILLNVHISVTQWGCIQGSRRG
jgi:hypothetical protein